MLPLVAGLLFLVAPAMAVSEWGQCGGLNYNGSTVCDSGLTCVYINDYYYQCQKSTGTPTTTTTTTTTSPSGSAPTLVAGYGFIRSVEDPTFHKYLRSEVSGTASDAVVGDYTTAALFKIDGGQLIQYPSNLYGVVEAKTSTDQVKLKLSWSKTAPSGAYFSWSGDTLLWINPNVTRPQSNAWLVCADSAGNLDVYVNLGPYAYNTPAGCSDSTIHEYTGPSAVP
ncbi:carbohydrate-binding module family 1 protein [Flagelloscypha sp. PMI_526]|nr:carbohydrate-binding module family 1 protein [Flagelloscypha sp. PMI_526]